MSLSREERKSLREIEAGLRRSDPGLAYLLAGFDELPPGPVPFPAGRGRGGIAMAVALTAARLATHAAAAAASAVCLPGIRERLGIRERPRPMARSTWHGLT